MCLKSSTTLHAFKGDVYDSNLHSSIITIEFIQKKKSSVTLHKKNNMSQPFYLNHKLFESD